MNDYIYAQDGLEKIQSSPILQDILFSGDDVCAFITKKAKLFPVEDQKPLEDFLNVFPEIVEKVSKFITQEECQEILTSILHSNNLLIQRLSQSPQLQTIIFDTANLLEVKISDPSIFDNASQLWEDIPMSQGRFKLTMEPSIKNDLVHRFFHDTSIQEIIDSPLLQEVMFSGKELFIKIKYNLGYQYTSKIIPLLEAFPHLQEKLATYLTTYGHCIGLKDIEVVAAESSDNSFFTIYLGVVYQYGLGVSQDSSKAIKWYSVAPKQGSALAQEQLDKLQGL